MTENIRGLRFDHARQRIAETCRLALGHGFECAEGRTSTMVRRDHGELRHLLGLRVTRSSDGESARVYCRLGFACVSLIRTWLPMLPEAFTKRRANHDIATGGTDLEFAWWLPDLTRGILPTHSSRATDSHMQFVSVAQLSRLFSSIKPWASEMLLDFLDGVGSLDELLPLFLNDVSLRHARIGPMALPINPSMLTLARRAGRSTLDAYAQVYLANRDFRRLCALYKDSIGAHFHSLVEGLHLL